MLFYCWASVGDDGPTLKQHWLNISRLLVDDVTVYLSRDPIVDKNKE